jgi:ribosomal-protein-alanine N-acetyltransferase
VSGDTLETDRLVMRRWRPADREPFAALNADPEVMRYFPSTMSREESDALVDRIEVDFEQFGFGAWALEVRANGELIGFTGLAVPRFDAPFVPAVEVGWRLARSAWGKGYASEAARAALAEGFDTYGLEEIVSFTYEGNLRSRAVMERLGMSCDPADGFEHPGLPGHRLSHHVLYRLPAQRWRGQP